MDSLWKNDSANVSIIAVHDRINGTDPLAIENTTTIAYDTFVTANISGYPSVLYDRRLAGDPNAAFTSYNMLHTNFGFADLSVSATVSGTTLTASVSVKPTIGLSGDYRLAMVVTEDSVHGTSASYGQHNYYGIGGSNNSTPLTGVGYNFNDSAQTIPGSSMWYKFVDRYTIPNFRTSPNGIAGSLPASMTAGTSYPYTFANVTVPSTWNSKRLRIVVMLLDNNANNPTYKQVLNTNNFYTGSTILGIASVNGGIEAIRIYPNPATDIVHVGFDLETSSKVQFSIYDAAGRSIYTSPSEEMGTGGQMLNFSTANLATGVYNIVITTETGSVTEKLSVVR